jgi:8-oxo-dGTP diphosphatase
MQFLRALYSMKILLEISDKDVSVGEAERYDTPYVLRKAARAIVKRDDGLIAFQHMSNMGHHKLPGGGIEFGESVEDALRREIQEEVGCSIEIIREVGVVIEYRGQMKKYCARENILQISYCYIAQVAGEMGEPRFEKGEVAEGAIALWIAPDEALRILESEHPQDYQGKFIVKRDAAILKEALLLLVEK